MLTLRSKTLSVDEDAFFVVDLFSALTSQSNEKKNRNSLGQ